MNDPSDPLQMTEAEKASLAASHAAIADIAAAAIDGADAETRDAALAALRQANTKVDRDALLNKLHVPGDAGEYEEGLCRLMRRIPDGWGRWISLSRGWYPIIVELDRDLAALDPGYVLHQVKEKYGGLRYYFHTDLDGVRDRMEALVDEAESRADQTCEACGRPGVLHVSRRSWYRTLCGACAAGDPRGYRPAREQVDELTPDLPGVWRVHTRGSTHLWDLGRREYTRTPGPDSGSGPSSGDGEPHRIVRVHAWPKVGHSFHLVYEDGPEADQWRISSTVSKIERVR